MKSGMFGNIKLDIKSKKRLAKTQSNVEAVRALVGAWHRVALFERRDGRKDALLCLDDRQDRTAKRYAEISSGAAQIQELLKENQRLFGLEAPAGAPVGAKGWRDYVDFVDALVGEAVLRTVGCSVNIKKMHSNAIYASFFELFEPRTG
ncbi:uncharacterized protein GBIM_16851 [Gryllus bimaculatus]|nr:uncharacterized protein GBIM_16851 [Gryllus bimaculatus]